METETGEDIKGGTDIKKIFQKNADFCFVF